jgi:hypothetical protein
MKTVNEEKDTVSRNILIKDLKNKIYSSSLRGSHLFLVSYKLMFISLYPLTLCGTLNEINMGLRLHIVTSVPERVKKKNPLFVCCYQWRLLVMRVRHAPVLDMHGNILVGEKVIVIHVQISRIYTRN